MATTAPFNFRLIDDLMSGVGSTRQIKTLLAKHAYNRLLMLVDEAVAERSAYFTEIVSLLRDDGREVAIKKLRGTEEPDYAYLDTVVAELRAQTIPDAIIGIGGGSSLDITKAVAVLLTNPGRGIDYRGFDKVTKPGVPTICIPSTAGSGSEVTINAVFTDKTEKKKLGINGRFMNATHAILDAEWTTSCPFGVALSSGMDAMTHTLESFMCNQHNSLTRVFSRAAFRLLYENLPSLVNDPENRERRQNILMGAHLAGIALFNSGSGISGAFSYPIGVHFKVPHGIAGALFLPSVVEFNVEHGYTDYAELLDEIEPHPEMDDLQKSRRFATLLRELSETLRVPKHLDQWGINKGNVEEVARLMLPLQAAFNQNPVAFSAEEDAPTMLRKHVQQ
jgi:alcohol dehydrogenase